MNILIIVALSIFVAAVLAVLKAKQPSNVEGFSFESRGALFTPAELALGILNEN